jgi:LuxR family maltose regulon positive regulatory protein
VPRAFRFGAPVLRPGGLTRPRLLRSLAKRWDRPLTLVIGGPGFGKTTLLAQAIAENRLAPRGDDVWLGLDSDDGDPEVLGRDLARAIGGGAAGDAWTARAIADLVWARSPAAMALILDDVHDVPAGSEGLRLLADVLDLMPSNGHLVLAGRVAPTLPFARLAAHGAVERLLEDDLRFDEGELTGFAELHHVDAAVVAGSAGWPAMAELAVVAERDLVGDYLWQEVLEPLGTRRRRVLAALIALEGGDDALLGAALGEPVALARDLAGVPLLAIDAGGRHVPHPLWSEAGRVDLPPDEKRTLCVRAADHLTGEARYAEAFELLAAVGAWERVPGLLTDACRGEVHVQRAQLAAWLERCPDPVRASAGGLFAIGVLARLRDPVSSAEPLRKAIEAFAAAGDVGGEMAAIGQLGHAAWWGQNLGVMLELFGRVSELADAGHPTAIALVSIGRALMADIEGDDRAGLEYIGQPPSTADDEWAPVAAWVTAALKLGMGDVEEALAVATAALPAADEVFSLTLRTLILGARWLLADLDGCADDWTALVDETAAVGIAHNVTGTGSQAAAILAALGDLERARRALAVAESALDGAGDASMVRLALARAAIAVSDGDEQRARALIAEAHDAYPFDAGMPRRAWRTGLALAYVLSPEIRPCIDENPLPPVFDRHRALARTVVAARAGVEPALPPLTEDDIGIVRTAHHVHHAAELAVALAGAGRPDGAALFEALGEPGRARVRELLQRGGGTTRAAKALLGRVPAPPAVPIVISLLGPLEVIRSGHPVTDPALRRDRVRALVALLAVRRRVTRDEAAGTLWPDFDRVSAANNLRVNLAHLERALEPERSKGEASWSIRREGSVLRFVTGPNVNLDIDLFEHEVDAAARAERDGAPSVALDQLLAAVGRWRGEPFADVPDAEWLDVPRQRLRSRFVAAALRAGQLLAGHGDHHAAELLAQRVLQADPWSEPAYNLLVAGSLARGDRTGAHRAFEKCSAMLDELDAAPSEATQVLARRVRAG